MAVTRDFCHRHYMAVYRKENPEKFKKAARLYYVANKDKFREYAIVARTAEPEKFRARKAAYYANNKAEIKERVYKWIAANRAKHNAYGTAWAKKNKGKRNAITARYAARHPEVGVANHAKRKALKNQATPVWANDFFMQEIYHLAKLRTKHTGFKWHVDHIVPLRSKKVCGLHCEQNLRVVPAVVNMQKHNSHWPDMS